MKKINFLCLLASLVILVSCDESEKKTEIEQNKFIIKPITSEMLLKAGIKTPFAVENLNSRNTVALGAYNFLPNTGNNYSNFNIGAYGVEITRSVYNGTITINPTVQALNSNGWGYTSAYLLNPSNGIISQQINKSVNSTNVKPFTAINISGSNKVWLLFWPKANGSYMYWY